MTNRYTLAATAGSVALLMASCGAATATLNDYQPGLYSREPIALPEPLHFGDPDFTYLLHRRFADAGSLEFDRLDPINLVQSRDAFPEADPKAESAAEPEAEPEAEPKAEASAEPESEPGANSEADPESEPEPSSGHGASDFGSISGDPNSKEAKPQETSPHRRDALPEAEAEAEPEAHPAAEPVADAEPSPSPEPFAFPAFSLSSLKSVFSSAKKDVGKIADTAEEDLSKTKKKKPSSEPEPEPIPGSRKAKKKEKEEDKQKKKDDKGKMTGCCKAGPNIGGKPRNYCQGNPAMGGIGVTGKVCDGKAPGTPCDAGPAGPVVNAKGKLC